MSVCNSYNVLVTTEPDQASLTSVEFQEESVYENASVQAPASVKLAVDELGLHIQNLQRQENGFLEEFDVISSPLFFIYNM